MVAYIGTAFNCTCPPIPITSIERQMMTTTFEKFEPGKYSCRNGGHSQTNPTIDVEIISPSPVCECGTKLEGSGKDCWGDTKWTHPPVEGCRYPRRTCACRYCGANAPGVVKFQQRSYSDHSECSRCGGEWDYGIGD